ncbi:MAG: DUF4129 domain-containing protein [Candidatus Thorarchaeota archaeon]|nr:DUF4129 domain-containing protein [Candidatus Thorarchaeota archaeon]
MGLMDSLRGRFSRTPREESVDIPSKLRNIKKLADAGKYDAAITLAYRTFEQMCGRKTGTERMHSETAHEFLDRVSKSLLLDSVIVDEFVDIYLEARFSNHVISRERYEVVIKTFSDLYPRIEGKTLSA